MKRVFGLYFLIVFGINSGWTQFNWLHTDGPFGCYANKLFCNNKYVFLPEDDFLYRSTDGISWEKLIHPVSSVFAVYGDTIACEFYDDSLQLMKVFVSGDNGDSWSESYLPAQIQYYGSMAICHKGIYLAHGHNDYYYHSPDFGVTWQIEPTPLAHAYRIYALEEKLYLQWSSIILRSDSLVEKWDTISTPHQQFGDQIGEIYVENGKIVVGGKKHIYSSLDNGKTWDMFTLPSSESIIGIAIKDDQICALVDTSVYVSKNEGVTWDIMYLDQDRIEPTSLLFFKDKIVAATIQKGIFSWKESDNKFLWANNGLEKGKTNDLHVSDSTLWAACANGLFQYELTQPTWTHNDLMPSPYRQLDYVASNELGWVCTGKTNADFFMLSMDHGFHWDTVHPPTIEFIDRAEFIDSTIYVFGNYKIFISRDGGQTWINTEMNYSTQCPYILAFQNRLYIPTLQYTIHWTDNRGQTWQDSEIPILANRFYADYHQKKLFAICHNQSTFLYDFYVSSDGQSWILCAGLPQIQGLSKQKDHWFFYKDQNVFYAFMGEIGHWMSMDDGVTWTQVATTQTGKDYVVFHDTIYLGRNGVYKSEILDPNTTNTYEVVQKASIVTISPNPFTDVININVEPESPEESLLNIYSSDGIIYYSGRLVAGENQVNISMKDLPPALYHVVFITKDWVESHSCLKL